jgi:hypothetical protein
MFGHIFLCILLSLATYFVAMLDWLLMQCYLTTSASPANPHSLLEQNVDAGDCWIMKTSNPKLEI